VPDEDVFARLPRTFRPAARALLEGLTAGYCDPYPLARGLEQMVGRARGVAVLPFLLDAFPSSAGAQGSLPIERATDLDRIDRLEQTHARSRLDQIVARTARRQVVRGDLDRVQFLSAAVHDIFSYFVLDARRGLVETLGARQLESQRARLESFIEPVARSAAEQWVRRPGARTLRLSRQFQAKIGPHDDLLRLGRRR
jgi:hypothetical protein